MRMLQFVSKLLECFFSASGTEPPDLFTELAEPAQKMILGQPQTLIEALIDTHMEATIEDGAGQLSLDCGVGFAVSHPCDADGQIIVFGSA